MTFFFSGILRHQDHPHVASNQRFRDRPHLAVKDLLSADHHRGPADLSLLRPGRGEPGQMARRVEEHHRREEKGGRKGERKRKGEGERERKSSNNSNSNSTGNSNSNST